VTYPQLRTRPDGLGIDWEDVRAQREATLDDQVARGVDDYETKAHAAAKAGLEAPEKPRPKPVATSARGGGSRPSYDRRQIVNLYVSGRMTVEAIATQMGCHKQTIRNNLAAAGVAMRDDRRKG
jgi:hypothetical protein